MTMAAGQKHDGDVTLFGQLESVQFCLVGGILRDRGIWGCYIIQILVGLSKMSKVISF